MTGPSSRALWPRIRAAPARPVGPALLFFTCLPLFSGCRSSRAPAPTVAIPRAPPAPAPLRRAAARPAEDEFLDVRDASCATITIPGTAMPAAGPLPPAPRPPVLPGRVVNVTGMVDRIPGGSSGKATMVLRDDTGRVTHVLEAPDAPRWRCLGLERRAGERVSVQGFEKASNGGWPRLDLRQYHAIGGRRMDRIIALLRGYRCAGFELDPASKIQLDLVRQGYDSPEIEVVIYPPTGVLYARLKRLPDQSERYAIVSVTEATGRRSRSDVCPSGPSP